MERKKGEFCARCYKKISKKFSTTEFVGERQKCFEICNTVLYRLA
jgi:hypothetical protein